MFYPSCSLYEHDRQTNPTMKLVQNRKKTAALLATLFCVPSLCLAALPPCGQCGNSYEQSAIGCRALSGDTCDPGSSGIFGFGVRPAIPNYVFKISWDEQTCQKQKVRVLHCDGPNRQTQCCTAIVAVPSCPGSTCGNATKITETETTVDHVLPQPVVAD